ncbi:MAG: glycosyltransferase family 39 protein [Acidobacteria bacterium]|nr:glycosyltransferase family 39 protein [Acidobacteriota bacterium]
MKRYWERRIVYFLPPFLFFLLFNLVILTPGFRYERTPEFSFVLLLISFTLLLFLSSLLSRRYPDVGTLPRIYRTIDIPIFIIVSIFLLLLFLLTAYGGRLGSDGSFYFSYLRSLVFDRDLNFANEYARLKVRALPYIKPTITGHLPNVFAIGVSFLWLPFYLSAHIATYFAHIFGGSLPLDGFSYPYTTACSFGSLVYGTFGVILLYLSLRRFFSKWIAFLSAIGIWLGSFLPWYQVFEPFMSHAPSFFVSSLFLYFFLRFRGKMDFRRYLVLGALGGLLMLVRWQNALFLLFPAFCWLGDFIKSLKEGKSEEAKRMFLFGMLFALSAFVVFLPQVIAWKVIYGRFFTIPQGGRLSFGKPAFFEVLFSSRHGLFPWSPVVYIGFIGSFLFLRRERRFVLTFFLVFLLMTYVNASIYDWWAGWAFGARRFGSLLPYFAVGLSAFLEFLKKHPFLLVYGFVSLFILANIVFMAEYYYHLVPPGDVVSMGEAAASGVKLLYSKIGNPFSYPANLLFALRFRVSPERYDLLVGRRFNNPGIDVGGNDAFFLGRGWYGKEQDPDGTTFRWIKGREGTFLFPLFRPRDYIIELRMRSFSFPGAPPQVAKFLVNGEFTSSLRLSPAYTTYKIAVPKRYFREGVNEVKIVLSYAIPPAKVLKGNKDGRMLGGAVDYLVFRHPKRRFQ